MPQIKTAEEKTVPIGEVQGWKKNPKTMVKKADFERLKNQILELGLYKRLVCCREGGKYIVLGGNQRHTGLGFKLNVSECCRAMKIGPARTLARNLDARLQFTGQRGGTDDGLRGMRTLKDGAVFYQERDRLWISNPLTGWTDADVNAYLEARGLPRHPAKIQGAKTIGCVFCGGGSQYTNSGYRILRRIWPKAWRQFMVEWRGGEIILALKYGTNLDLMRGAIEEAGGLERLAKTRPWLFDFTRKTPIMGYQK